MAQVLVLATTATKADEADYLIRKLSEYGITSQIVDISLNTGGKVLDGVEKCKAMQSAAERVLEQVTVAVQDKAEVIIGIGGGTGGEIVLSVMRSLPVTFPKILTTTLPFDPRMAVADNSIIIVPTLADISGLNAMLREVLENTALIGAGLCRKKRKGELVDLEPSVGITALGATEGAIKPLIKAFAGQDRETTVFHANGFGGAAFARFASRDAFDAIIDLTPHELTRIHLAGAHINMPNRFSAGGHLPRVVLPGALNFIGLGEKSLVQSRYLKRPHYEHSGLFTHVKLTTDEMVMISTQLADHLNALTGPCSVIVPMGGFSHHDCAGGAIEDPELRHACLDTLTQNLKPHIQVHTAEDHISSPNVTDMILSKLAEISA